MFVDDERDGIDMPVMRPTPLPRLDGSESLCAACEVPLELLSISGVCFPSSAAWCACLAAFVVLQSSHKVESSNFLLLRFNYGTLLSHCATMAPC
eukprot:1229644-Amphidinium_carterae.2